MRAPPAAASASLTPDPVPPPVPGAPTGKVVLEAEAPVVAASLVEALALADAASDDVSEAAADAEADDELVSEAVGVAEAVHVGVADALSEGEADALSEAEADAEADAEAEAELEGEALLVGVQQGLGVADALSEGEADALSEAEAEAEADAEAEAEAELEGEALEVAQPDVSAAATPPHDPASTANTAEISKVAVPVARPTCPANCSFSQLLCRDRRKIVTPWIVSFSTPRPRFPVNTKRRNHSLSLITGQGGQSVTHDARLALSAGSRGGSIRSTLSIQIMIIGRPNTELSGNGPGLPPSRPAPAARRQRPDTPRAGQTRDYPERARASPIAAHYDPFSGGGPRAYRTRRRARCPRGDASRPTPATGPRYTS